MTETASPQLMDRMYRHQRHIYDASRRYYLLGRDEMIRRLRPPPGGQVLELGCGTGRNLVAAARHYPLCRFYGCDISQEMLKTAMVAVDRANLRDRVCLAPGDATCFNPRFAFKRNRFDRIIFSYTLSMIPDWEQATAHAMTLLAPEGQLHVVDFGQCERLPAAAKSLLFAWLRKFDVTPRGALEGTLRQQASAHDHSVRFTPRYRGYAWHAVVESH
jgi:S-adenosylmethionine-diacylgycerolhomoserine-N-methlytransferase